MQTMLNIDEHRFTKADALKLIPTLSEKTFKNWVEADLVAVRVKGKTRLLSALGVIKLAAMHEAVEFGVRPPAAAELAEKITPRVYELCAALPQFPEGRDRQSVVLPTDRDPAIFYAVFELDCLVGIMLTRILRPVKGLPLDSSEPPAATRPRKAKRVSKKGRRK